MMLAYPEDVPIIGPFRLPLMLIDMCIVLVAIGVAMIYFKKIIVNLIKEPERSCQIFVESRLAHQSIGPRLSLYSIG